MVCFLRGQNNKNVMVIFYHLGARLRGVENVRGNGNLCLNLSHNMACVVLLFIYDVCYYFIYGIFYGVHYAR